MASYLGRYKILIFVQKGCFSLQMLWNPSACLRRGRLMTEEMNIILIQQKVLGSTWAVPGWLQLIPLEQNKSTSAVEPCLSSFPVLLLQASTAGLVLILEKPVLLLLANIPERPSVSGSLCLSVSLFCNLYTHSAHKPFTRQWHLWIGKKKLYSFLYKFWAGFVGIKCLYGKH